MSTPEFPNAEVSRVKENLLRPLNPDSLPQELLGTRHLSQLTAVLAELRKPEGERSEQILNNGGLGYLSEHVTAGVLNRFFRNRGINLEIDVAPAVFDRADGGVIPVEYTINEEGKTILKNGDGHLNGGEDAEEEITVHLSEYNRTADLALREKGYENGPIFIDATISSRRAKLGRLTPKARQIRRFEHPRLGAFGVFIVSLDRKILPWDENFELVAQQTTDGPLDVKALTINENNQLVERVLEQLLLDIESSLPELDRSGKVTKRGKLHKDGEIDWELVNVADYFYSKLERIHSALHQPQTLSNI